MDPTPVPVTEQQQRRQLRPERYNDMVELFRMARLRNGVPDSYDRTHEEVDHQPTVEKPRNLALASLVSC